MGTYNGSDRRNDVIRGSQKDDWMSGRAGNDILYGFGGNDRMLGEEGNDILYGGDGNDGLSGDGAYLQQGDDILYGEAGNDSLGGGLGNDTLDGGVGNDELGGGDGTDKLYGGAGDDHLTGGAGADSISGGSGADLFFFNSLNESNVVGGVDTLLDFKVAEGDRIGLNYLDSDPTLTGYQPWTFDDSGAAGTGRLTWDEVNSRTVVEFFANDGDPEADSTLYVNGQQLTYADAWYVYL